MPVAPRSLSPITGALPLAATLVAAGLLLAACGGNPLTRSEADSTTAPKTGTCRTLSAEDITQRTNTADVVPCDEPHTAETFAVGSFPASTAKGGYDGKALGRYALRTCTPAYLRFLGADESASLRSTLSWAWFGPSESGWEDGARWFRCDLVGGPAGTKTLPRLPTTAKNLLVDTKPPDAWMLCAAGEALARSTKVACDRAHTWRAVTTIRLGEAGTAWPGDRLAQVRSQQYCRDSVAGWLGYPDTDFDYGATVFGEAEWQTGNRRSVCWARTAR